MSNNLQGVLKTGDKAKSIILWGGIGLLVIVGASILAKKFLFKSAEDRQSEGTAKESGKEVKTSNLSFTDSEYKQMADRLATAMFDTGTDEKTIYAVLSKLQNKDDWNKLVAVFGKRKEPGLVIYFEGNLIEWLESELDGGEKKKVSEILSKIGVNIF